MKKYKINIPIYDVILQVWIGGTEKDFVKTINKLGAKLVTDGRSGFYDALQQNKKIPDKVTSRILWIERKTVPLVVHESLHFVTELMAYKNIHLTETENGGYHHSSEEAWAYLLEWIFVQIMKL